MTILRESAKGQPCLIRIPGICNHNPETTVLCHFRLNTGTGQKPDDLQGAFGCSDCHAEVDRRTRKLDSDYVRACFNDGKQRTQEWWVKKGYIKIVKPPKRCVSEFI